ncbi:hypothetical protein [Methanospirillum hungatei]|jgi:hypothetical protein|uniref:hypothetical protein n=1 Tax=Methanospirillum hungatei TaxID=2203 RepID=UPI0009CA56A1|nr:hypothetical protein [Methanospirillum hungatei]MBP9008598.1 hypothetical protein [Methanospirillum sp.]OQA59475.1 MAG: hypothetical protein BWY45_00734 [Euryarchaeota archaeon ADurb.Bin294]HOW03930.1 hypothetical protein [Methanospirillum hungatei]
MNKKVVYLTGLGFIIIAMIIAGILLATSTRHDPVPDEHDIRTISVSVSTPLTMAENGDVLTLSYGLETSRFVEDELTLTQVEVLDKDTGEVIHVLEKEDLQRSFSVGDDTDNPIITLKYQISSELLPAMITHRLFFISDGRAILPFSVTGGEVQV